MTIVLGLPRGLFSLRSFRSLPKAWSTRVSSTNRRRPQSRSTRKRRRRLPTQPDPRSLDPCWSCKHQLRMIQSTARARGSVIRIGKIQDISPQTRSIVTCSHSRLGFITIPCIAASFRTFSTTCDRLKCRNRDLREFFQCFRIQSHCMNENHQCLASNPTTTCLHTVAASTYPSQ